MEFFFEGYFPESLRLLDGLMARRFAGGEFISTVLKINPEKVAPAAISDEETPMSSATKNLGDGEWAINSKRWWLVTINAKASKAPRTAPIAV
ncbi:MAG: hypothetical protein WAK55_06995 [Xanthobacteraceae bacterium]